MAGFKLAVPAYTNPGDPQLTNLLASSPLPGIVIMDNNNGSSAMTGSWLTTADSFRAAGILTLAYVYSSNGTTLRTLAAVEADINNALVTGDSLLHFDGIFIDEMLPTTGTGNVNLTFYQNLYSYIVATAAGIIPGRTMTVAMNAGDPVDDRYPSTLPGVIFCTFEDTEAHYNGSGWVGGNVFNAGTGKYRLGTDFPQQQFMHLVYNAGNSASMEADVATAFGRYAGWVYVTNDTTPNPWDTTPAWGFSLEAASAAAHVAQAPGTEEQFTNDGLGTVTSGGTTGYPTILTGQSETWTVNVTQAFPTAATGITQFHVCDTATGLVLEKIAVTSGSGAVGTAQTWSVIRGAEFTTPLAHTSGFTIKQVTTAGLLGDLVPEDALAIRLKDFGAVGDGATDNTGAFIAWAAAMNAAPNGARAFIDWGNFGTTNPVPVITNNGVSIDGAGWTQTAAGGTAGSTITALHNYAGGPMLTLAGEGIQCEKFAVNGANQPGADPCIAAQNQNPQFLSMMARYPTPGTITTPTFPGSTGTAVTNTTGHACLVTINGGTLTTNGVQLQVPGAASPVIMTKSPGVAVLVPYGGIVTVNWSAAPTGWTWQPVGVCLDIQNGAVSTWAHNIRMIGVNTPSIGIMINDTDSIIMGCKPVSVSYGVVLQSVANGALIEGNHITPGSSGQCCIWIPGTASHVVISGNRFDNYVASAVQLTPPASTPSDIMITGNCFDGVIQADNTYALIGVNTTLSGIRNLKITNNSGYAGTTPPTNNRPSYGIAAQTITGAATTNASRIASVGSTVTGNSWLTVGGVFGPGAGASQAFGNFTAPDGQTWGPFTTAFTSFATGGAPNLLNTTAGNSTTMVAGTWYYAALMIPYNVTLTGIAAVTGGTGGTDKWILALWPAAGGAALANSATAGITAPGANTKKQFAFTSSVNVDGPGAYIIGLQSNGTTAQFLSFTNAAEGFITGSVAGTFGTIPSLSPASTYTQNVGPFASTY